MEIMTSTVMARVPVTILRLQGNLDSHSAGYFDAQLRHLIDSGVKDILLDFSRVPYMSSVGIRSLSAAYNWLHPVQTGAEQKALSQALHDGSYHAPHLKLLNPSPGVLKILGLVALDRYLPVFTDEQTALADY
jgi:hypothetical protein